MIAAIFVDQTIDFMSVSEERSTLFRGVGAGGARGAMAPPIFRGKIHIDFRQDLRLHERLRVTMKILKIYVACSSRLTMKNCLFLAVS